MGMRRGSAHGLGARTRRLLISALAVALLVTLGASSPSAATSATCSVTNTDSGRSYPRLQQAVDAAKPGANLVVTGTCRGGTFIDKSLAIVGTTTKRSGKAILDGSHPNPEGSTRVLTIKPKVKVRIQSLVIRDGRAGRIPDGGGISNKGRLTLRDVIVRGNTAWRHGGGIYNAGVLRMEGGTAVKSNLAAGPTGLGTGSGVYNIGYLVIADRTRIHSNSGGAGVINAGTLVMNDATTISANDWGWGRSSVHNTGTLVMNDNSSVTEQAGVTNSGTVTMNDASSIHHNVHSGCVRLMCGTGQPGAGVHNTGTLTLNDSASIHHNRVFGPPQYQSPEYPGARGGGVYNEGTVYMNGNSHISANEAGPGGNGVLGLGGGIYNASGGTLTGVSCAPHTYANVYGNGPDDCYIEP